MSKCKNIVWLNQSLRLQLALFTLNFILPDELYVHHIITQGDIFTDITVERQTDRETERKGDRQTHRDT